MPDAPLLSSDPTHVTLLFQAQAVLGVPQSLPLEQLQGLLESLADDLMVELKLQVEE